MTQTGYLVECFWQAIDAENLTAAGGAANARGLRRASGEGRRLRFLGAILVPVDETVFHLFNGQGADVRAVSQQSGFLFERLLESMHIADGPEYKEER